MSNDEYIAILAMLIIAIRDEKIAVITSSKLKYFRRKYLIYLVTQVAFHV